MPLLATRALITGGATGIGLECARELLRNGIKSVCIGDIRKEEGECAVNELKCEFGKCSAMFVKCDVKKKAQMERLFQCAKKTFGTFDLVINNAGILDDLHWEREIEINLSALVRGSFLAIQYMGKNNGGNGGILVNLSSILGLQTMASVPVYVATKHAVIGFSRSLGMPFNYFRTGVRVLTICPGVTITPLITEAHTLAKSERNAKEVRRELDSIPSQEVSCVAQGLLHILNWGETGSIWVTEGGQPIYEVEIPDHQSMRKCSMV